MNDRRNNNTTGKLYKILTVPKQATNIFVIIIIIIIIIKYAA